MKNVTLCAGRVWACDGVATLSASTAPTDTLAPATSPPWAVAADGSCCTVAVPESDGSGTVLQTVDLGDLTVGSCAVSAPCAAVALSANALHWALVSRHGARSWQPPKWTVAC